MSAETSRDVSLIKDEDILRRMWQDTEDFGRKKEIRAHMYKLREARLRDFYNSGEVSTDIKQTSSTTTESKTCSGSTHADSLADHSFISMKTKEIRDSESPTRDVSYRITDALPANQGWTIQSSNKQSDDGKTFTTTKTATTSGTEQIQGGKLDYSARNDQQATVYKDGDDKNFKKAVGASSNTLIQQEAAGGDENSTFKSTSTKATSSSKYVTEQRSTTTGDVTQSHVAPSRTITSQDETLVSRKIYTDNIPNELKTHPSYVDGKTKVTQETKKLADGTILTTTRYEIKGGSQSSKQQKSSSQTVDSRRSQTEAKSSRYISETQPSSTVVLEELQPATTTSIARSERQGTTSASQTARTSQSESKTSRYSVETQPTSTTTTTVTRQVYDSRGREIQPTTTTVTKTDDSVRSEPRQDSRTTTKTTTIHESREVPTQISDSVIRSTQDVRQDVGDSTIRTTLVKNVYDVRDTPQVEDSTTSTVVEKRQIEDRSSKKHDQQQNETFITAEKQDNVDRAKPVEQQVPRASSPERRAKPEEKYVTPEKRQPIKPGRSEFDDKLQVTEGQYDTTYRSEFTNKRISVDVSPTHDAFARSLRAVTPDRISKGSSPSRGTLRTSTSSLRSSTSPEKMRHPSRLSPERRSTSPKKTTRTGDTKSERKEIDSSTLTRRRNRDRSRSPSPTSVASDFEFVKNRDIVTDLDTNETTIVTRSRPSTLEIIKKTTKKITDRSPTSPLTESPKKSSEVARTASLKQITSPSNRALKRTDTYEERCRQILGITGESDRRRSSLERRRGSKETPTKEFASVRKSPEKRPQVGRSPDKEVPQRKSSLKDSSKFSEFPSQIRRSPEKQVLGQYPQKTRPSKDTTKISEFPSQIRKTPEKEHRAQYPGRKSPQKEAPKVSEFPSQIRKTADKQPLGQYPQKTGPSKVASKINEFPSQIRKTPEKAPLGSYPERKSPVKERSKIDEFPSQIRKSPEKEPLGPYPEKARPLKESPKISEFPSQIRKSPEKEPLEPYPERKSPIKERPKISEFPSQVRKSPEREPLEPYPERRSPEKETPKIGEFPSQIRKYPEEDSKFPSQLGTIPDSERNGVSEQPISIDSLPSPIRPITCLFPSRDDSPDRVRKVSLEDLRISPEKDKIPTSRKSAQKDVKKEAPKINEFPSQIRKSSEKVPLEKYPEKSKPTKEIPKISEFPSQTKKSPQTKRGPAEQPTDTQIYPTSAAKKERKVQRTTSSSSSTTDEEKDIEEVNVVTEVSQLEGRIPVEEPTVTKKFIDQLCRDDEIERTDLTKKTTQSVLNKEVVETGSRVANKTVKKDATKKTQDVFIENERNDALNKFSSPVKKTVANKFVTTATAKQDTRTTKKITESRVKENKKTTLYDIENLYDSKQDNRVHVRTHRIDNTVNKKVTKTAVNGDVARKTPARRPQPEKVEEPKTKKLSEKKTQKVVTKVETESKQQTTPKRHVVTTTITVSPRTRPSPTKSPVKSVTSKTTKKPRIQNGHVSSDDESIAESLEGEVTVEISTSTRRKEKISSASSDQVIKKKSEIKTQVRGPSKPDLLSKPKEKRVITTKSIIINNDATEREVIVDLQRSKSSREATPDRICPLPVETDDGTVPRYPDLIAEPDDDVKRKFKKLSDLPILEGEDREFRRIEEVEDSKQTIDRVEKTDTSLLSVDQKINKFLDTAGKVTKTPQGPAPKVERPKFQVDEDLESDECLLNVSQKVNKFINTAEQLSVSQEFAQRPKSPKCQHYPEDEASVSDKVAHFITTAEKVVTTPKEKVEKFDIKEDKKNILQEEEESLSISKNTVSLSKIDAQPTKETRRSSPTKEATPPRRPSPTKETTPPRRPSNQYASIKTESQEIKYPRRDSSPKLPDSTPRSALSPTGHLRSTESVKKAKALFESINREQQVLKQRDILSRPSVFEGRKVKSDTVRKLQYDSEEEDKTLKSTRLLLEKARSRPKSPEKPREVISRRSKSPEGDVPGYMRPLDRSLRPNSPHRENVNQLNQISKRFTEESSDVRETKFGVALKRTDSGRAITSTTTSKVVDDVTDAEIEEIFDLEVLELLLEKVSNYELRRKIRTQIRLVKKSITEGKLNTKTTVVREKSPAKTIRESKQTTEYQSSYQYDERRSSSEYTRTTRSQSPDAKPTTRGKSPEKVFQTQLKKTSPSSKVIVEDSKPEWVKQRNLKKVTEATSTTRTTSTSTKKSRSSPQKETKPTDIITSSYGVGPTDENGSPLFGLKALKARNKTDTTKVQGTVIRSQYYSENGQEPVGEISVTKYSSDPRDLGRSEDVKTKGVSSVTTTQKFGYKDTPSLKSLSGSKKKKAIEDEVETKTTKLNRRGSVKALSQKFIENAVETSKSERQSSYPKAGLILRTSSFKGSASSGESREGSAERTVEEKSSTTRTVSGETFLTNRSNVKGVQDVISRMKATDVRDGDSVDDVEARGLLNKFLGAQVILSGLEAKSSSGKSRRSTKITTTIAEGGKQVTKTRTFQHPITDADLDSVWDEQTLRLLLEQSTDYEERRNIRARLRQVMAEQEACTELVEKASQDQTSTTFEGASHTKKTVTEGSVTTTQATSRVTSQQVSKKPLSPFAKFRQLDKQNSLTTPPSSPKTPSGSGPLFKFTDPAVSQSASTIKDRLLFWCRIKTKEYENIQLDNFSTSWADGLAFCALIHHFLPEAFDYHELSPKNRRHNFTLAFQVADEKADIAPLLDVDDMVATRKPDWKCVFTYVQSIYRRFKDED